MLRRSIIKIPRWRIALWKHTCLESSKTDIIDPDDPTNGMIREYSNGVNSGLRMAVTWYEKYVEGKK